MANSADIWIIVSPDGEPVADFHGNVPTFTSREEAESWLAPGECAEKQAPHRGNILLDR